MTYALQRTSGLKVDSVQYSSVHVAAHGLPNALTVHSDRNLDLDPMGNVR